jgi:twitching motility protein PilT
MEQMLFGEILVNFHLVSQADLDRCLELQQRIDPQPPLGQILIQQKLIDEKVLNTVLTVQKQELSAAALDDGEELHQLARTLEKATIDDFLNAARRLHASDLFLSSGRRPSVRRNGMITDLPVGELSFQRCRDLLLSLLTREQVETYRQKKHVDLRVRSERGRFRLNVFRHLGGIGGAFRVLHDDVRPFETLGLPDSVREIADYQDGLVLVTGATGSGKSTTLAALIELINKNHKRHIITLEDPIESIFKSQRSFVSQREINSHTTSYAEALRAALREDPDVIVVGEMRDPQTMAAALTAAETGHLVLGTMHTNTAASTVVRVIDQFPAPRRPHVRTMMSTVLRAVICQELVPSVDGEDVHLASEVMLVMPAIANLIRENREWQIPNLMQLNRARGMRLMDESLAELVRAKKIAVEQAHLRATDKTRFLTPV